MDQQRPKFTPEEVDEQLEQLIAHPAPASQDQQFIADLSQLYQGDERSLAQVWLRLGLEEGQPASTMRQAETFEHPSPPLQPVSARLQQLERKVPMHQAQKRPLVRVFSLLAAACVAALIVSALLIVSNLAHQHQASHVAAPNVQQEQNLPPGIYVNDTNSVFRLNTQTHQALWQHNMKDVAQIIPAGNAVYILQSGQFATGVVKLDANTGAILWNYPLSVKSKDPQIHYDAQITNLVLAQNRLYVGWLVWSSPQMQDPHKKVQIKTVVDEIYVLNTADGKQQAAYANTSASTLAVSNGILAISRQNTLQIYDATNGKPLWHAILAGDSPAQIDGLSVVNNLIYAAFSGGQDIQGQGQSYIAAYNLTNGQQVWKSPTFPQSALNNFVVDQHVIYFGTLDGIQNNNLFTGHIYAYDVQSNKQLWKKSVDGGPQEPLVVSNGVLYTVADSGSGKLAHIMALATTTGDLKWQKPLPDSFLHAFALGNGVIYLSSSNSSPDNDPAAEQIDAVSEDNGQLLWQTSQYGTSNITLTA